MSVTVSILLAVRPANDLKTRYRVAFQFDYKDLPFYPNFKPSEAVFAHFNHGDSNLSDAYFAKNRSLTAGDIVLFHDNSGSVARVDGYRYDAFDTAWLSERDIDGIAYVHPDCHNTAYYQPLAAWEQELLSAASDDSNLPLTYELCNEDFGKSWAQSNGVERNCNYAAGHAGNCSPLDHKERLDAEEQARANHNDFW